MYLKHSQIRVYNQWGETFVFNCRSNGVQTKGIGSSYRIGKQTNKQTKHLATLRKITTIIVWYDILHITIVKNSPCDTC